MIVTTSHVPTVDNTIEEYDDDATNRENEHLASRRKLDEENYSPHPRCSNLRTVRRN